MCSSCINTSTHKIVFLLKNPLYLVCVSQTNETEEQVSTIYLYELVMNLLYIYIKYKYYIYSNMQLWFIIYNVLYIYIYIYVLFYNF